MTQQKILTSLLLISFLGSLFFSCSSDLEDLNTNDHEKVEPSTHPTIARYEVIKPKVITDTVANDTDDPAIWINYRDKDASLVLGTDKDEDGALYVFNLKGKVVNIVGGLQRPNNVDVAYGLKLGGKKVDIAVVTERLTSKLRVFSLPDMKSIDGGGIPIFEGEAQNSPMGVALYKKPSTGEIYAIVSRKEGPGNGYLWQYRLHDNGTGKLTATKVRSFGQFSGINEIEAIAVDNQLGYVYYSDEGYGVRKYYADPAESSQELAVFGTTGFLEDQEGIAIYQSSRKKGYIIVSDQQANQFQIFTREGSEGNPHNHKLVKVVKLSTIETDGIDVTHHELDDDFDDGLFVAMSEDKTFHFYSWEDIMDDDDDDDDDDDED